MVAAPSQNVLGTKLRQTCQNIRIHPVSCDKAKQPQPIFNSNPMKIHLVAWKKAEVSFRFGLAFSKKWQASRSNGVDYSLIGVRCQRLLLVPCQIDFSIFSSDNPLSCGLDSAQCKSVAFDGLMRIGCAIENQIQTSADEMWFIFHDGNPTASVCVCFSKWLRVFLPGFIFSSRLRLKPQALPFGLRQFPPRQSHHASHVFLTFSKQKPTLCQTLHHSLYD